MIELRGMTWNHSRGFDPMVATAEEYAKRHPEVKISWDKRSLQAFADRPIEQMASYDLMVIDHPHVGEIARNGLLLAFEGVGRDDELAQLAKQSVGASHPSYEFDGRQWSLAIDAATPVSVYRPDLLDAPPTSWDEVVELARAGRVGFALIPINALMTFFGLLRNQDFPVAQGEELVDRAAALNALEMLREIVALVDPRCLELDPIGIYDWMGSDPQAPAYSPFGYGYTNYSRDGYCQFPLQFCDAPGIGGNGPRGTVLGGTGIAISSRCEHADVALDYSFWIAGAQCQSGLFFNSGGQPGNAVAWEDEACNAACRDFFSRTRRTLDTAWVRPRYDGYMKLQEWGGDLVHACLRGDEEIPATVDKLQEAYARSKSC